MPRTAIVVPTPDPDAEPARTCLERVEATTRDRDVAVETVVSSGPDFRFSASVNEGIDRTPDADAWVLLNDDCFVDDGWLEAMWATADAHPEAGLVGAMLRYPDGRVQHAGGGIAAGAWELLRAASREGAPLWALRRIAAGQRFFFYHHDHVGRRIDFLTAACVMITRRCRDAVGLYDEDYIVGAEDVDHSLRTLQAGMELALAREATAVHRESHTIAEMTETRRRSETVFESKWDPATVRRLRSGRQGIIHPPTEG